MVIGLAFFYGGLAQLLAGMWEFRTGNTFGATAFSSYGAFWLAVGISVQQNLIPSPTAFGYFLLGWTIFTGLMFLGTNTGLARWDASSRPASITDGSSQTLLLTENLLAGPSDGNTYSDMTPTNWAWSA